MSKILKIGGIAALVVVVALAAVAAASAQSATPTPQTGNKITDLWERMHQAIAKALGITVEQYDSAVSTAQGDVLKQAVEEGLLTQEQADQMAERWADGQGMMGFGMPGGRGHGGSGGPDWEMGMRGGVSIMSVAAEKLGMTVEELVKAMGTDKSIADVAKEKGVDVAVIVDAAVAQRTEELKSLVAAGRITQAKADTMLASLKEQVQKQLESKIPAGCGSHQGYRQGFPQGGFRGSPPSDKTDGGTEGTSTWGRFSGRLSRGSY